MTVGSRTIFESVAVALERAGIIDRERFGPTFDLAWPRVVTGFSIRSKQTVDLAMVGIAVGTTGTAGLAFAMAYMQMVTQLGLGIAGGTVSLVSQNYGGGEDERASLVIKQSVLIATLVAIPIIVALFVFADPLIGLLGASSDSLHYGSVYLVYVAPAVLFEMLNLIASRTYTGVGDTFTEMVARGGGAVLNVVISGLLIFGFDMRVVGAALGTTISSGLVTLLLAWGMIGRRYGWLGMQPSPVPITRSGPWFDLGIVQQLVEISTPEIGRRLVGGLVVFPLLWIAASFGPVVVTAFEVGRRVRGLISSVNWGLALASSSLVGQHLGAGEEGEAGAYGASIIRLAVVVHVGLAILVLVFASPIARVFVTDPTRVARTAVFVSFGAVSAVGWGLDATSTGALLGAGDTRLPFVATMVGRYGFALPVAALGLFTPVGIVGLYLAMLLETFVPGGVNYWLFSRDRWKVVSRRYRPPTDSD